MTNHPKWSVISINGQINHNPFRKPIKYSQHDAFSFSASMKIWLISLSSFEIFSPLAKTSIFQPATELKFAAIASRLRQNFENSNLPRNGPKSQYPDVSDISIFNHSVIDDRPIAQTHFYCEIITSKPCWQTSLVLATTRNHTWRTSEGWRWDTTIRGLYPQTMWVNN